MNRRERRAARAKDKPTAAGYEAACARLDCIVTACRSLGGEIRFALPPKEIFVAAGLDQVGERIARSPAAQAIIEVACAVPLNEVPTLGMLDIVLAHQGIAVERVTLGELGISPTGPAS